jgi:hypothetical protein
LHGARRDLAAYPLPRNSLGGIDHGVIGRDRRERSLEHDQRAEERAPLGGKRDAEIEEEPEHRVEHRGVGAGTGGEVLRHEARQCAFEVGDVDAASQAGNLQDGLRDRVGIAPTHSGH